MAKSSKSKPPVCGVYDKMVVPAQSSVWRWPSGLHEFIQSTDGAAPDEAALFGELGSATCRPIAVRHQTKLLQVMPWPIYQDMRYDDLKAIYAYLKAIPSLASPPP